MYKPHRLSDLDHQRLDSFVGENGLRYFIEEKTKFDAMAKTAWMEK